MQSTPAKQHDECKKRADKNTAQFKDVRSTLYTMSQELLDWQHAMSASMQFATTKKVNQDWIRAIHQIGAALQQFKVVLQRMLDAVEVHHRENRPATSANR